MWRTIWTLNGEVRQGKFCASNPEKAARLVYKNESEACRLGIWVFARNYHLTHRWKKITIDHNSYRYTGVYGLRRETGPVRSAPRVPFSGTERYIWREFFWRRTRKRKVPDFAFCIRLFLCAISLFISVVLFQWKTWFGSHRFVFRSIHINE